MSPVVAGSSLIMPTGVVSQGWLETVRGIRCSPRARDAPTHPGSVWPVGTRRCIERSGSPRCWARGRGALDPGLRADLGPLGYEWNLTTPRRGGLLVAR